MTTSRANKKRILISPLNWGLGHATRLVPVVKSLLNEGHYVLLAGEGSSLHVLREEFSLLEWIEMQGFNVSLSKGQHQWLKLMLQLPALIRSIRSDKKHVSRIIKEKNIDLIISDHRYGFYSENVYSIIITHQTHPYIGRTFSFLRPITNYISRRWLSRFNECWIPDDASLRLAGSLARPVKGIKSTYLGISSRLMIADNTVSFKEKADVLIILSGPEPQREELESTLLSQLKKSGLRTVILGACPGKSIREEGNIIVLPHVGPADQKALIENSRFIICRSGYSTLMDLLYCRRRALLIPTPGQFEQEYLAKRMYESFGFRMICQKELGVQSVFRWYEELSFAKCGKDFNSFTLPPF